MTTSPSATGTATGAGTVLALGGGGFSAGKSSLLDEYLLDLCRERASAHGRGDRPRVLFLGTASGDAALYAELFLDAYRDVARPQVLSLFQRDGSDLRSTVLAHDAVFVGGGSTLNLLALWRLHGLDAVLAGALSEGVVLAGISAGMNCWFEASVTDSYGPLTALHDGLGLLRGSACPHYDGEPERRPAYLDMVGRGALPAGYAVDDGCALLFRDGELVEAVAEREGARAFRVHRGGDAAEVGDATTSGPVAESPVPVRHLG